MSLRKFFPALAVALGLVLGIATSGFKDGAKGETALTFYKYVGPDLSQSNIQDLTKYIRAANTCSGRHDVCGVYLLTDNGPGSNPDPTEFAAESNDLWTSQQNQASADPGVIIMKN